VIQITALGQNEFATLEGNDRFGMDVGRFFGANLAAQADIRALTIVLFGDFGRVFT
jgi:hypothetical protein